MNLLVHAGKAPQAVSTFMAGDRLVALNKNRDGSPPDVRPIVVGESPRRLVESASVPLSRRIYPAFFSPCSLEWLAGQELRRSSIV